MFGFLSETIDTDFLLELDFIVHYDRTKKRLQETVDMSDQKLDQFIKFCIQNNGHLSTAKREKFFYMLSSEEIARLETIVRENIPGEVKV
ncbi:MAG: cell filamentation protein Fic, partial [Deltaproteobacteria bacterium]|nr:cell filamentation protein Fic [Deltaproteobacteria bacterium]